MMCLQRATPFLLRGVNNKSTQNSFFVYKRDAFFCLQTQRLFCLQLQRLFFLLLLLLLWTMLVKPQLNEDIDWKESLILMLEQS